MNEIYYKYRADSEYTEAIFSTGQVYLSTAAGLNDPFECSLQDIAEPWIRDQITRMKQAGVAGFVMEGDGLITSMAFSAGDDANGADEQYERARHYFDALTKVAPDLADGWYQLSCTYSVIGEHREAAAALRKAYALNPNDASTALNLGLELLHSQDTPDEALTYLHRAERLGHRRAHEIIAWIAAHDAELRQASERGPSRPQA